MQKGMVLCLVMSAVLAASCATLHKSMLAGVGVGIGTGAVASMATRGGKGAVKGALFRCCVGCSEQLPDPRCAAKT